ncbi:hypothetical protein DY000_02015964 [Brassica cretica]|uniref:Uncharacterized protein n=2 Tax=Brassica cretica TaxID=69181 RepID=A0ABQ7D2V3_BRACR|nr:hypothetical protein DY000_02015964 [Brassica cretica]
MTNLSNRIESRLSNRSELVTLTGAILIRLKLKGWDPMNGLANTLIKAWLNGQFQGLVGMIYEVLDRERMRTLDTSLQQLEQEVLNHQIKPGVEKLNKPGAEKLIKLEAEKLIIVSDIAGLVSNKEEMKSNAPELKLSFRDLNYLPNMHGKPGKHVRKEMDCVRFEVAEIRLFRPIKRVATRSLIHFISYWINRRWRI